MTPNIDVGDIWLVNLEDALGHEQEGTRPVLIIAKHSTKSTKMTTVIPFTSSKDASRLADTWTIKKDSSNGLICDSVALVFQIKSLSQTRFIKKLGAVNNSLFKKIKTMIKNYLNLS